MLNVTDSALPDSSAGSAVAWVTDNALTATASATGGTGWTISALRWANNWRAVWIDDGTIAARIRGDDRVAG